MAYPQTAMQLYQMDDVLSTGFLIFYFISERIEKSDFMNFIAFSDGISTT